MASIERKFRGLVLVVEDNSVNAMVNRVLLEKAGVTVEVAEDGLQAVEKASRTAYDLILMDLSMPNKSGTEAAKEIREGSGPSADKPIVMLTAHILTEDDPELADLDVQGSVTKPITVESMIDILESHLSPADPEK